MQKWVLAACAGAGVSLAAAAGYFFYARRNRTKHTRKYIQEQRNIDMEEILDDDVLEDFSGAESGVSGSGLLNSDDELDSDAEADAGAERALATKQGRNKMVTARDEAKLKNLARKIRTHREKLSVNDTPSKKLLKSWLDDGKQTENKENAAPAAVPAGKGSKLGRDAVFYNLFACYAESASHDK